MDIQELNEYIKNYIENDKTNTAIMIDGMWGSGKSYYIKTYLKEYLNHYNYECVIISLYGLNEISEISKAIYYDLRSINIFKNSEATSTTKAVTKLVAKTILNGLTSKIGFDIANVEDEDLKRVYESLDLSGKLIILEDLERSKINIIDIFGYVNNLTEQDGVKVLIVANEDELKKTELITNTDKQGVEKQNLKYTEDTQYYLSVKEKTIGDTIYFNIDSDEPYKNIISDFKNEYLNIFTKEKDIYNIKYIMQLHFISQNLRIFTYACQKTVDTIMFIKRNEENNLLEEDFLRSIFYSMIYFSFILKTDKSISWKSEDYKVVQVSNIFYPMFKFCYDFIIYKKLDLKQIEDAMSLLKDFNLYNKHKSNHDNDLLVLENYYQFYENDVKKALNSINSRLKNIEDISFYRYDTIARSILNIEYYLKYNVDETKKLLVGNLYGRGEKIKIGYIFSEKKISDIPEIQSNFDKLYNEIEEALNVEVIKNFNYLPEQAEILLDYVRDNESQIEMKKYFLKDFQIPKLIEMFYKCSPEQKSIIRSAFRKVYMHNNNVCCYKEDIDYVTELINGLKEDQNKNSDKVQELNYIFFIDTLEDALKNA